MKGSTKNGVLRLTEWKLRQWVYHRTQKDQIHDWLDKKSTGWIEDPHIEDQALIEEVLRHFRQDVADLIYPAKSYMVAIVYSKILADTFGEDLKTLLSDSDLLGGLDPWFQPYPNKKFVYDAIFEQLETDFLSSPPWQVRETIQYCRQEFLLGPSE
jgi:hypothetical protein